LARCDTADLQKDFLDEAQAVPSGFTQTDQNGGVVSLDDDDWRTSPLFLGRVAVEPAYPNPVSGGLATVPFRILQFNEVSGGVYVRSFDADGDLIPLGEAVETSGPGLYTITINPAQLGTTELHRLFVTDVFGDLISYGDLDVR
jgi:hypothetical protein